MVWMKGVEIMRPAKNSSTSSTSSMLVTRERKKLRAAGAKARRASTRCPTAWSARLWPGHGSVPSLTEPSLAVTKLTVPR